MKTRIMQLSAIVLALQLLAAPAWAAPKIPNVSPSTNFPGEHYLIVVLKIVLGVIVIGMVALFAVGLAMTVGSLTGKREGGAGRGLTMAVGSVIVIVILFSFSSFLQSWVDYVG